MHATSVDSLTGGRNGGISPASHTNSVRHTLHAGDAASVWMTSQWQPVDDMAWPMAHQPEAPAKARHAARQTLQEWHVSEDPTEAALLVISELVTNAIEHALEPVILHLHNGRTNGRIWIGVTDGGPAQQAGPWARSCDSDERGRGLALIDALTEAHGIRTHANGTSTHWARINPNCA